MALLSHDLDRSKRTLNRAFSTVIFSGLVGRLFAAAAFTGMKRPTQTRSAMIIDRILRYFFVCSFFTFDLPDSAYCGREVLAMKLFLIFLAGMMLGGTVGVCAMCLFFVAGESDRQCPHQ